jgi:DNA helicase IV
MRGRRVTGVDDEVLDREGLAGASGLAGEAALLAALGATRTGRMRDIVGTVQAEQDAVIRSAHSGILVVQGGPGTGKTAVALHRAAYLLYTRRRLAERGVLVVGPSPLFMSYISQVLPGLGETNVLLRTVGELFPGVTAGRAEDPLAEEVKGRATMAGVLAEAREAIEADLATLPEIPGGVGDEQPSLADIRRELWDDPEVRARLDDLWPALTPQRLLEDLFAGPARLAAAAPALTAAERAALRREPGGWSAVDVPLLDEAAELLGRDERTARARSAREQAQRTAYAQGVLDISVGSGAPGGDVLRAADLLDAAALAAP